MKQGIVLGLACLFVGLLPSSSFGQADIEVVKDVRYVSRPGGALALDAYLPSGPGPHSAVLVIPGGKWFEIDKAKHEQLATQIAERGVAAFAIEYRPSTSAPFPAALEDVQAAVRFVRSHAARFHIDPRRLGAVGGSSGGHLAALLATWGEGSNDSGTRVSVAISWSGPTNLVPLLHHSDKEVASAVQLFLGCSRGEACVNKARTASPIAHVDPSDGAIYLANSTDEIIPASQAEEMAAALERSNVPHELTLLPPGPHGFTIAASYKGFDPAFAFLTEWVDPDAATATGSSPSPNVGAPSPTKPSATEPDGTGEGRAVEQRTAGRDWLPVLAISALVIASAVFVLAVILLRRVTRTIARDGAHPDQRDPGEDHPSSLVGSRSDDTGS